MSEDRAAAPLLSFRIGLLGAFIAPIVFVVSTIVFFVVFRAFDMNALTAAALAGLFIAAPFARRYDAFWEAAARGVSSKTSVILILLLFSIGLTSSLIKSTGISEGFIWLSLSLGVHGGLFIAITFAAVCAIAMATASSLGTMFTAFPIFYPAGFVLGADPVLLAGAILSGALFGDNLAPISDSTVISSTTQRYRTKDGTAEVPGVVGSRLRYSLTAAAIAFCLFLGIGTLVSPGSEAVAGVSPDDFSPAGLWMLIAVVVLLGTAIVTRNIFKAVTAGLVSGIVVGLLSGVLEPAGIIGVEGDAITGFLIGGVANILPIIGLNVGIFAMLGVLESAGVLDRLVEKVVSSGWVTTPRRAELAIGAGILATTTLFAGVNGPSMLVFGPIADRIGAQVKLHPFRRANVMDCFALGLGSVVPVVSSFLFIASLLTVDQGSAPALDPMSIFTGAFYPLVLTCVILTAVLTGWGRRYEGIGGSVEKDPSRAADLDADAPQADPTAVGDQRTRTTTETR
ncbi:Na+/H+ antiporter NhaC family protein [Leucobacter ruminantium]|uniref:Na+/H+ antiporter NhaC family protein n=1 Tax=Leucobacter ruminantium TaxID=1289170 RepID=A0A939LSQ7_9MICO|nr:Na+/H+ antiporter NhaC family protein [Leucobacter ruminantium]MBO1804175.1 Na+/H+ antiporter NhaC family protein [Leucobacter ruminantium]